MRNDRDCRPITKWKVHEIMKHHAVAGLILSFLSQTAGPNAAFGQATPDSAPTDLAPILGKVRDRFHAPGIAAAAIRDGRLVAVGAVGVRDLDSKEPVGVTDRSMIGSCGKSATRLLIGRLVDQGKIRWDSTLAELLPDVKMRDEYRSVTVGDIIGHRGGLQPYTEIGPKRTPFLFELSGSPREQHAAFIAHLLSEQPSAPLRTRFVYSNAGYGLLGHIAERLTDKAYEQLMRDEVFRPLGMTSAIVGMPRATASLPGWGGHERSSDGFQPVRQARLGLPPIAPAGGMSFSIEDFAKLGAALINVESGKPTEFLGKSAIERLPELRPGSKESEGEVFFGGDGQYTAAFALWPSKGLAVVVQSNAGDSDDLCEAVVDAVRAAVAPEIPSRNSPTAGPSDRPRYGFQIKADGDEGWTVENVLPGSPAEAAGLKKGDAILAMNDKPLAEILLDDRSAMLMQSPLKFSVARAGKTVEITLRLP